jgi:prevent-host-death family protein
MVMKRVSPSGGRRIPASRFKARCLALLDDVARSRRALVVTKRGRPVAMVVPVSAPADAPDLRGSVVRQGDLVTPLDEDWDAEA